MWVRVKKIKCFVHKTSIVKSHNVLKRLCLQYSAKQNWHWLWRSFHWDGFACDVTVCSPNYFSPGPWEALMYRFTYKFIVTDSPTCLLFIKKKNYFEWWAKVIWEFIWNLTNVSIPRRGIENCCWPWKENISSSCLALSQKKKYRSTLNRMFLLLLMW